MKERAVAGAGRVRLNIWQKRPATASLKRTPLRRVSKHRTKELRQYAKLRHYFLNEHPFCMVRGCAPLVATDVHHMAGRWGKHLLDTEKFLAVCSRCHLKIHCHPKWARGMGYLQYE